MSLPIFGPNLIHVLKFLCVPLVACSLPLTVFGASMPTTASQQVGVHHFERRNNEILNVSPSCGMRGIVCNKDTSIISFWDCVYFDITVLGAGVKLNTGVIGSDLIMMP